MRTQLSEIEWLDKIQKNFQNDYMELKPEARLGYESFDAGYQGYGTMTTGGTISGTVTVSNNGDTGYGIAYIPPVIQIRNTTGLGSIYADMDGHWYACSSDGNYYCVTFEDGQTFATDSMSFVRVR